MSGSIELITLTGRGTFRPEWTLGPQRAVAATAPRLHSTLVDSTADAVLCLDARLPLPAEELLRDLLAGPGDAWHGGLRLGLAGQPPLLDHVNPLWMLNASAPPDIASTSWRISLRALLVRTTVLRQLGGPDGVFDTLGGAGLDLGLRWIRAGALTRHIPDLVAEATIAEAPPSEADGIRLVTRHHGRRWAAWAVQRALVTGEIGATSAARLLALTTHRRPEAPPHYEPPARAPGRLDRTVSVIVPTIDRYTYLEPLLHQLAAQTVAPHEVIVADQTPGDRRRDDLGTIEPDLPVTVIGLPQPGQSTARNAAIEASTGELLLLLDDDLDIEPDLIADHLRRLQSGVDATSGGVDDATAGPPPEGFRHRRASDVLPGGHTILRRASLRRSGLFDPAFDHGPRADHDLGMRLHLGGAVLIYDPTVMVFHFHAPAGGLRVHGARKITRASARRSLTQRNLPAATELYLGRRYFTAHQNAEADAVRIMSILSGDGPRFRRLVRAGVQLALLPGSLRTIRAQRRRAEAFLADHRELPQLTTAAAGGDAGHNAVRDAARS